jgi:hypothetical protein
MLTRPISIDILTAAKHFLRHYTSGTACLADFDLSLMYSEFVSTSQAS